MPELPEVQTVLDTLAVLIKDRRITNVRISYPNIIDYDLNDFKTRLVGEHFRSFKRRGKYLIFELDTISLLSHLRMEGKYYYTNDPKIINNKHVHVIFELDDGKSLIYHDVRKFGRMELISKNPVYNFKKLGLEPFDEKLDYEYLKLKFNNHRCIKENLLDQSIIAGIGNIYADEILFKAKIHPESIAFKLKKKHILAIIDASREILNAAIINGGTTIRSYTSSLGVDGKFQLFLKVHMQKDKKCTCCDTVIQKIKLKGRGTYFCEKCQKKII